MKRVGLAIALLLASSAWGETARRFPSRPPPDASNTFDMSIFRQPGTKSGSSTYNGQLQLYSEEDKENVFTVAPSPVLDASTSSVNNPGYRQALSPEVQKNMGVQISIPLSGGQGGSTLPQGAALGANRVR